MLFPEWFEASLLRITEAHVDSNFIFIKKPLYPCLQTAILLMSAPNHPMALHLLWGKSKTLSKSWTIRPQDFYGIISCYCPLIIVSSFFHLALPSISLGLGTPFLLQANPHWFYKTQFNWKHQQHFPWPSKPQVGPP